MLTTVIGAAKALFGGGAAKEVIREGGNVIDNLFTSDEERLEAERLLKEIEQRPQEAQWKTTLVEANHRSVWVAGWRPAIGWVCASSLAAYYIPQFMIGSILWARACWATKEIVEYPLSIEGLVSLVGALLGMGTLRTIEKFGKVTK